MSTSLLRCSWLSALLLVTSLPASANVLSSQISEVIVFNDRASITRNAQTRVTAGEGTFVFEQLPLQMDPASLRVRATGPAGMVLGAVDVEPLRGREAIRDDEQSLLETIAAVEQQRREVDDRLQTLGLQLEMLQGLTRSPGGESGVAPSEWANWLSQLEGSATPLLDRRRAAQRQADELDEELTRLRRQLEDLGSGQRDSYRLSVAWRSPAAGEVELSFDYQVRQTGWRSVYELRLDTASGELALVQQAELQQNTGEDWTDTRLTLSTARPSLGGRLPQLPSRYLDIIDPTKAVFSGQRREMSADAVALAAPAIAEPELASAASDGFSAQWQIPGVRTLRSGSASQRLTLQQMALPVTMSARTVPALSTNAWLYAAGVYAGESPLPAGRSLLFQDGIFVGEGAFSALPPGGELELSFGVDQRIEILRRVELDERGSEGLLRRQNRQRRLVVIEVHNRHQRPMDIHILDQIPVSRDQRIIVELEAGGTPPDESDVDDRPGLIAWQREYGPGERREIRFGYVVTWPQDVGTPSGL